MRNLVTAISRIWSEMTLMGQTQREIVLALRTLNRRTQRMESTLMALRDEFSTEITELGTAIGDLAGRIDSLPDADAITQADIDQVKSAVSRIQNLAIAAPEVPEVPTDGGTGAPAPVEPGDAATPDVPFDQAPTE